MNGPKWFLNASKYGHIDFFDDNYRGMGAMMCSSCKKHCDFGGYRSFIKDVILAFLDGILNKNPNSLNKVESSIFDIATTHKHDHMGYDPMRGGFC